MQAYEKVHYVIQWTVTLYKTLCKHTKVSQAVYAEMLKFWTLELGRRTQNTYI